MQLAKSTVSLILFFSFLMIAISIYIGFKSRKMVKSDQDFFGGTGLFGPVAVGLSSMSGIASAFAIVGVPGIIYQNGNPMAWWMLGSSCFALGYMILGKRIRAMAELGPIASLGDISDLRFNNNKTIKALFSIIISIGCVGYLASQIAAGSSMFGHLLGVKPVIAGFIIFGLLTIYTVVAGEVGGLLTQAFQGFIMVLASVVMIFMFFRLTGGFGNVFRAVGSVEEIVGANGVTKELGPNFLNAWGNQPGKISFVWMLIPLFGALGQPSILMRMYALKDPKDMPKAGLVSGLSHMFVAFLAVAVANGVLYLVATGKIEPLANPDDAIYIFADNTGILVQLLTYAAVLAASMSSASAYLTTTSTLLSRDLPDALGIKITSKNQIKISRLFMAILGFASIIVAIYSSELVAMLGTFGYGTLVSATFPIFIVGLLWEGANEKGVLAGIGTSFILNILSLTSFEWPGGLPGYYNIVSISLAITIIVSLITPKQDIREDMKLALRL